MDQFVLVNIANKKLNTNGFSKRNSWWTQE